MGADLDLLCISVYCTADDLLQERRRNARRRLSDAEIVTLRVAQVLMGIPSDRRFLRAPRRQLGPPVSSAAQPRRAAQAAGATGGDDRVADRRVRLPESDTSLAACRGRRLWLLAQPLALVLGDAAASRLCRGRDATGGRSGRGRPARAGGRVDAAATRAHPCDGADPLELTAA